MTGDERLLRLVCGSVKRALYSQTPATLRAYSFAVDNHNKRILLRAHFGEKPSEDDLEAISIIETEIDADFLDQFEAETDTEVVATGTTPSLLSGGVAYLREGEAEIRRRGKGQVRRRIPARRSVRFRPVQAKLRTTASLRSPPETGPAAKPLRIRALPASHRYPAEKIASRSSYEFA